MGPGEIFAPARNFKPTSDPFRIRDCLIGIIGRIKRLRVFLAIGALPIPQAVAEPPHHGELHSWSLSSTDCHFSKGRFAGSNNPVCVSRLGMQGWSISMTSPVS